MFSLSLSVRANDLITYLHYIKNRLNMIIKIMELLIDNFDLSKFSSMSSCLIRTIFCILFWMINLKNITVNILLLGSTIMISADSEPSTFN